MMDGFTGWWELRAPREKRLLRVLGAVIAALLLWYGGVMPLRALSESAEARHREARIHLEETRAAASVFARGKELGWETADLRGTLESSAADLSLPLDIGAETQGMVTVAGEGLDPASLFSWMAGLSEQHGIAVFDFTAQRDGEGQLDFEAAFVRVLP
jgi:general secretion pathway protein M